MSLPNHGANPAQLANALAIELPEHYIDFSENTNPFGPPRALTGLLSTDAVEAMSAYPDPHTTQLIRKLAEKNYISAEKILAGNGAAELIFLVASLFRGKRIRIVEPAFSEYRDACEAYGCDVDSFVLQDPWMLSEEQLNEAVREIDLLFICSPSNPTGIRYEKDQLISLLSLAEKEGVHVVIDEAFYDFCEEQKGLQELVAAFPNVILLRSLTKMYAIAGLRLGYVIANESIIIQLKQLQPPWSVNGLAQKIGLALVDEEAFVQESVRQLQRERKRMKQALEELGFSISPSTVNFYLLSARNKHDLKELFLFLIEHGIVPRHTYNFKGLDGQYLRFAVKDKDSNNRLLHVLKKWRSRS